MNRIQAVDAANVIMHIRPDWQQPGIIAVLLQLDLTYPAAILHSVKVAANPNSRNPGAITATPTAAERQPVADPATRLAVVTTCVYCDPRGYLPNGQICHHEPPEAAAERAHRGANLARTVLAETQARHEQDQHQPEQETTNA
jgi:hypothetical protein